MLVLFHHLATKYRWSTSKSESGVQFGPFALPLNGLPMTFVRKDWWAADRCVDRGRSHTKTTAGRRNQTKANNKQADGYGMAVYAS
jgi:hypothetical protein